MLCLHGDRKEASNDVAKKLKIDNVHSELLPHEKLEKIENLLKEKEKSGKLIFIGDGINDAPALSLSDIGIAMGAIGQEAAIEAADIVIMTDEPSKIIDAIEISKKTMKIVKENIVFAIFVKILVLILSGTGLTNMWLAVFADVGVSIIAILNALRVMKGSKNSKRS